MCAPRSWTLTVPPKSTGLKWPPDQKVFDAFNASLSSITGPWYRVFLSANSNTPLYFGAHSSSRFDPKSGRFGVCYFARTPESAFAEALDHLIDENGALESIHARSRFISSFMISPKGRNEPRAYDLTGKGAPTFPCYAGIPQRLDCEGLSLLASVG
ncbi:MAG: RES family NAD+ phosphorylase [Opitutales bacterium]